MTLATVAGRVGLHRLAIWLRTQPVAHALHAVRPPSFARVGACEVPNTCTAPAVDPNRIDEGPDRSGSDRSTPFWTPGPMPHDADGVAHQLRDMLAAYRDPVRRPPQLDAMKRRLLDLARVVDLHDEKAYGTIEILSEWLPAPRASAILSEREGA